MRVIRYMTSVLVILSLFSCQDGFFKKIVPSNRTAVKQNVYGAYAKISLLNGVNTKGEAIAMWEDTLIIQNNNAFIRIPESEVENIELLLSRNRGDLYTQASIILAMPTLFGALVNPDYAESFLAISLGIFTTGMIAAIIEYFRKGDKLFYPDDLNNFSELKLYCRFPSGIPPSLDFQML